MNSYCSSGFWRLYDALPPHIQRAADEAFERWKKDTKHPGLHFKPIPGTTTIEGDCWSARINDDYRALCAKLDDGWLWWGIGDHDYFDRVTRG